MWGLGGKRGRLIPVKYFEILVVGLDFAVENNIKHWKTTKNVCMLLFLLEDREGYPLPKIAMLCCYWDVVIGSL